MKSSIKRKNYYLDEVKIRQAQRILKTKTQTEAIHKALDLVGFQRDILHSLDGVRGKGHVRPSWR